LELLSDYRANHPQWEAAVDLLPAAQSFPQLASWYRVKYILGDGVFSIYRMDTPVEEIPNVLKDMDNLVEELLDD
jgi:hypothetical protein